MNRTARCVRSLALFAVLAVAGSAAATTSAPSFSDHVVDVEGGQLHYRIGGHGPPLILLHGYAETSRMWQRILPALAQRFTVIAPDLPGIGESSIPADGLDVTTAAIRVHQLAHSLGITRAEVVGHDIGLMVAYAYAAQFPGEVQKLAVMDAFLPGVGEWRTFYDAPAMWHFRFHGPTPEALVQGRERIYFEHFWNDFAADRTRSIPEADRRAYTEAYARPGRMRAAWGYFAAFPETAREFEQFAKTKLTMPVLVISGEKASGEFLVRQMKLVASEVKWVVLKDTGHWLLEERPGETTQTLLQFL
jgi:pimeloyl-ACP methyl ester carboxylesterase